VHCGLTASPTNEVGLFAKRWAATSEKYHFVRKARVSFPPGFEPTLL
jgi:hypothetical protein